MSSANQVKLELHDIQSGVLRPRPTPYAATFIVLRIDTPDAGRELMLRLSKVVATAAAPASPAGDVWVSVGLTFQGLAALGLPRASLESFPWELRQGMAARATVLGDTGESSPEHWEHPFGTDGVHVVIVAVAPSSDQLEAALAPARETYRQLSGIEAIWRQDCHTLAHGEEPFGYYDGISHPAVAGSGIPGSNPREAPLAAGEFVLGYADETGGLPPMPEPEVLGRNGTYWVLRKLHQRVAAFRQFLKAHANSLDEEERIAAKLMGRWRSGAPLARCPLHDDPALGVDPRRNNDFFYGDDPIGYKTPRGCHIRRMNPRDAPSAGLAQLHRIIRRRTTYGPELPDGVIEDDGLDRGVMLSSIGAHLDRQFEFIQSEWINEGTAFDLGEAQDPIVGAHEDTGSFSIPQRPIPRRLHGLSRFVITRGGEYCFMPGLRALRWLSEKHT